MARLIRAERSSSKRVVSFPLRIPQLSIQRGTLFGPDVNTVTLTYSGAPSSRTFDIYGAEYENVELRSVLHKILNGGYVQEPVGYRYKGSVDFAPLQGDKAASFWLQGFAKGTGRQIVFDYASHTESLITIPDKGLKYDYFNGVSFANGFKMKWAQNFLNTTSDDGSTTRIIKPTYTPGVPVLAGDTLTLPVDLLDDDSIEIGKTDLQFIEGSPEDVAFGFLHDFLLNTACVFDSATRLWLTEFCLWRNKQIDTRDINPDEGALYTVVCPMTELVWQFENNVWTALKTSLNFLEKNIRTSAEVFEAIPPFILDGSRLDE